MTTRVNLAEETRLKATAEEVNAWERYVAGNRGKAFCFGLCPIA
jgi:hypothetical protein